MPLLTRQRRGRGQSTLSYWLVITLFQWLLRRPRCLGRGPSHVSENLDPVYKRRLESPGRHHLKQRIAVAMQRGNAAAVLGTMTDVDNACAHALVWCTNHHFYSHNIPTFLSNMYNIVLLFIEFCEIVFQQ